MSDSLADGTGQATEAQARLYERWLDGGMALSIIGEVQIVSGYPEKPGNLVLDGKVDEAAVRRIADLAAPTGGHIWPQLGHAGAMAYPPISDPVDPSALSVDGVECAEMTVAEVEALPAMFARSAARAKAVGFSGVEIHAAHGFLLSQFLSPLFNHRQDGYGGSIEARSRILVDIIDRVRTEVGPEYAIGAKINATDELDGGLTEADSLVAIEMLGAHGVDLIDISGGTYFPGAPSSSDRPSSGPYYADFARRARGVTDAALMLTGGVKTRADAFALLEGGAVDVVGLARPFVLDPDLANEWIHGGGANPIFPRFASSPPGGVTAWYTMELTSIAEYDKRDAERAARWNGRFGRAS